MRLASRSRQVGVGEVPLIGQRMKHGFSLWCPCLDRTEPALELASGQILSAQMLFAAPFPMSIGFLFEEDL